MNTLNIQNQHTRNTWHSNGTVMHKALTKGHIATLVSPTMNRDRHNI